LVEHTKSIMNLTKAVRGITTGAALVCFSVSGHGQSIPLPFGGLLGTTELATWSKNNMEELRREMDQLRQALRKSIQEQELEKKLTAADMERVSQAFSELRSVLEQERKLTLTLAQGFDKLSRQHRAEMADTKQSQQRAQEELTRLRDAVQKLEQERVAMEGNLSTLRAQLAEITRQPGRTPDGANR
jgi:hypothetical protein